MKISVVGLIAAAAFAAGALAGWIVPNAHRAKMPLDVGAPMAASTPAAVPATSEVSFSGMNARHVKLFSALKEPIDLRKQALLFEALQELQPGDFAALLDHVEKLPREVSWDLLRLLLERWVAADRAAAQEWLVAHRAWNGAETWVKANPEAALHAAQTIKDQSLLASLLPMIAAALPGTPEEKLARIQQFPAGRARDGATTQLLHQWGSKDPAAAFDAVDRYLAGTEREETRSGILSDWARREPAAALQKLETLLPNLKVGALGNPLVNMVIHNIPDGQVRLALEWLADLPTELRAVAGIAAAKKWAAKDPAAALAWCLENGIEPARGHRAGYGGWSAGVLGQAIETKPLETVAWLEQLPAGAERDRLSERALADSFWLLNKGESFVKAEAALLRLYGQLPPEAQVRTARGFGERRAREGELTDLQTWAQNFPAGTARSDAIAGAMSGSFERDASRADALLATMTSPADRDAALRGLATAMEESAPAEAAAKAATIGDFATRKETLDAVVVPWLKRDSDAARKWLGDAGKALPRDWTEGWLNGK